MYSYTFSLHQQEYTVNDISFLYILATTNIKTILELKTSKFPMAIKIFINSILQDSYTFNYNKLIFTNENNIEFNFHQMNEEYLKFKNSFRNKIKDDVPEIQNVDQKELLKQKILMLENQKKNIENQKKEKLDQAYRTFEVDYKIYTNNYDKIKDDVPEIFINKFSFFENLKKEIDINDKELCKTHYIQNYDIVSKNIGSTKFSNIFDQREVEENI